MATLHSTANRLTRKATPLAEVRFTLPDVIPCTLYFTPDDFAKLQQRADAAGDEVLAMVAAHCRRLIGGKGVAR